MTTLTRAELRDLPPVIDVATTAAVLGVATSSVYDQIRAGRWPTPVLRLGRRILIPSAGLLDLIGIETDPAVERTVRHA